MQWWMGLKSLQNLHSMEKKEEILQPNYEVGILIVYQPFCGARMNTENFPWVYIQLVWFIYKPLNIQHPVQYLEKVAATPV